MEVSLIVLILTMWLEAVLFIAHRWEQSNELS